MTNSQKKRRDRQFESARSLARAMNRAHSTVNSWIAREDWPFAKSPPWSVAELDKIIVWMASLRTSRSPELAEAQAALLREQLELLNLSNAIASGVFVNENEARRLLVAATIALRHELARLGFALAVRGIRGESEIRAFLATQLEQICNDYRAKMEAVPQAATAEVDAFDIALVGGVRTNGGGPAEAEDGRAHGSREPRTARARPEAAATARQAGARGGHARSR
jgi:hypothetical protein